MKNYSFTNLFFFLLIPILLLSGCRGSKPVAPRFYLIEFPSEVNLEGVNDTEPVLLEIMDVEIHPAFATYEIAIREKSNALRYYANHRWAARPEQSLGSFIINYYNRNKNFQLVDPRFINHYNYYKLGTIVHQLEVLQEGKVFNARLHIEFRLHDPTTNNLIMEHFAVRSVLLDGRDLNLFSNAISELVFDELQSFSGKVIERLSD